MNRKDARNALGAALSPLMTSAQQVYAFYPHDFGGQSPVVFLTSAGTRREKLTGQGYEVVYLINAHLAVWYGDGQEAWDEQQAEDLLDDLEGQLADAVLTIELAHTGGIKTLRQGPESNANETLIVGGTMYLHEVVSLEVKG